MISHVTLKVPAASQKTKPLHHQRTTPMPKRTKARIACAQNLIEARKRRRTQDQSEQYPIRKRITDQNAALTASGIPEVEDALDPDLRDFCKRQGISMAMDSHSTPESRSSSSEDEDDGGLDAFEEITEPADLNLYSIFLEKAQHAALEHTQ